MATKHEDLKVSGIKNSSRGIDGISIIENEVIEGDCPGHRGYYTVINLDSDKTLHVKFLDDGKAFDFNFGGLYRVEERGCFAMLYASHELDEILQSLEIKGKTFTLARKTLEGFVFIGLREEKDIKTVKKFTEEYPNNTVIEMSSENDDEKKL